MIDFRSLLYHPDRFRIEYERFARDLHVPVPSLHLGVVACVLHANKHDKDFYRWVERAVLGGTVELSTSDVPARGSMARACLRELAALEKKNLAEE